MLQLAALTMSPVETQAALLLRLLLLEWSEQRFQQSSLPMAIVAGFTGL